MTKKFKPIEENKENYVDLDKLIYKRAPHHPGIVLKDIIMKGLGISNEVLSKKSGIPLDEVNKLTKGSLPFNEPLGEQLNQIIGSWVKPLLDLQKEFDYYRENGCRTISHADNSNKHTQMSRSFATSAIGKPSLRVYFSALGGKAVSRKRLGAHRARFSAMKKDKDN